MLSCIVSDDRVQSPLFCLRVCNLGSVPITCEQLNGSSHAQPSLSDRVSVFRLGLGHHGVVVWSHLFEKGKGSSGSYLGMAACVTAKAWVKIILTLVPAAEKARAGHDPI